MFEDGLSLKIKKLHIQLHSHTVLYALVEDVDN